MDGPLSAALCLAGIVLAALSGVPGLFLFRGPAPRAHGPSRSGAGERVATWLLVLGSALGIASAAQVTWTGQPARLSLGWGSLQGAFDLQIDGISALFLAQICLIAPLGSIFGLAYWALAEHPDNGRKLRLFYGLMTAGLALLVVAKTSIVFLMGWEVMAIAAFFLVTTEDRESAVRKSGFLYLAATRIGTLCLFAMFAVLRLLRGDYTLPGPGEISSPLVNAIFLLALVGFGLKAGLMPMHVWLPSAHANAPSHVSALMSGVLIKMGVYGLVRVGSFVDHPPLWWGALLLGLGMVSGVLGVAFAIGQHDLKRLLAYHSVENIGIIVMGLGIAVLGRSLARTDLVVLGMAGALLHVFNHGLFKALLFLSAGAVLHATGTREIDQLGGLARRMPSTASAFLLGALAICGLPPLNGFVSELFVYLGLARLAMLQPPLLFVLGAFAAPALALIGALALACFVKVYSAVFLGTARSRKVEGARECSISMTGPMAVLGALCALVGLFPSSVLPVLDRAARAWAPSIGADVSLSSLAPLGWLSVLGAALLSLWAAGAAWAKRVSRPSHAARTLTWDCGFAASASRAQYTASSFADFIVGVFAWALRPEVHLPRLDAVFPEAAGFSSHIPDVVLDRAVLPASRGIGRIAGWFRWIQHGNIHIYLLYILGTLVLAMLLRR